MKLIFSPIVFFVLFWLALSGHYTTLLVTLGITSCILVVWISKRMDIADDEGHPIHQVSPRILVYFVWLGKEIIISSWTVCRMILSPKLNLEPQVTNLPAEKMTNMEKATYANSITLTPGTLTLEVDNSTLEVHTIQNDMLEDLKKGEMMNRVNSIKSKK